MDLLSTSFFYPLVSPSSWRLQPNELPLLFAAFSLSWTAGCQQSNNPVRRLYWDQLIIRSYGLVSYSIAIPADISLFQPFPALPQFPQIPADTSVPQPFHQKKAVTHRLLSSEFLTSAYLYSRRFRLGLAAAEFFIFSAESWTEVIPTFTVRDWYSINSSLSAEPERGFSVYYNVAANEAWCKGCRRRMFEIMDKIRRCDRRVTVWIRWRWLRT